MTNGLKLKGLQGFCDTTNKALGDLITANIFVYDPCEGDGATPLWTLLSDDMAETGLTFTANETPLAITSAAVATAISNLFSGFDPTYTATVRQSSMARVLDELTTGEPAEDDPLNPGVKIVYLGDRTGQVKPIYRVEVHMQRSINNEITTFIVDNLPRCEMMIGQTGSGYQARTLYTREVIFKPLPLPDAKKTRIERRYLANAE